MGHHQTEEATVVLGSCSEVKTQIVQQNLD